MYILSDMLFPKRNLSVFAKALIYLSTLLLLLGKEPICPEIPGSIFCSLAILLLAAFCYFHMDLRHGIYMLLILTACMFLSELAIFLLFGVVQ